jgi:hypothetical protein
VLDDLPKGIDTNSQQFCDAVPEEVRWVVITINEKSGIEEMMIHMDNCNVRNSAKTTKRLEEF